MPVPLEGVSALARMEERRSSGVGSTANPLFNDGGGDDGDGVDVSSR